MKKFQGTQFRACCVWVLNLSRLSR